MSSAKLWNRLTNVTFHNRTKEKIPFKAQKLLSYGPKFISSPASSTLVSRMTTALKVGLKRAERSLRLHLLFLNHPPKEEHFYHYIPPKSSFTPQINNLRPELRPLAQQMGREVSKLTKRERALLRSSKGTPNVTPKELEQLADTLQSPLISIVLADKNMGFVAVYTDWLKRAILEQLEDPLRYAAHPVAQARTLLSQAVLRFRVLIQNLHPFQHGSHFAKLFNKMKPYLAKAEQKHPFPPCTVKPLAKVHKPSLQLRLITQAHNSPFQPFCFWFAKLIHPITTTCVHSYLKDSTHLLEALFKLKLEPNEEYCVVVADASNLYGNLPLDLVQDALAWALDLLRLGRHIEPSAVSTLLECAAMANRNCFVEFGDVWYQQLSGIAMGRADGVDLANLALGKIENNTLWTARYPPGHPLSPILLHRRFIDDSFTVIRGPPKAALDHLRPFFTASRVTWNPQVVHFPPNFQSESCPTNEQRKVNFLDLSIWRHLDGFRTALYVKPTSLALYIPPFSLHHPRSYAGWIRAEAVRFVRNCSSMKDYMVQRKRFYWCLRARGFPAQMLQHLLLFSYDDARGTIHAKLAQASDPLVEDLTCPRSEVFGERIFLPHFFHPQLKHFDPATELNQNLRTTIDWANGQTVLSQHNGKFLTFRFSSAWRSLPSLASLVESAFKASLQGKFFPPNLNRGEVSPEPTTRDKNERNVDQMDGIPNADLLDWPGTASIQPPQPLQTRTRQSPSQASAPLQEATPALGERAPLVSLSLHAEED